MELDFAQLSAADRYRTIIQTLIPRPIAWVLSDNGDNRFNLAPFSYFNAVSSDPPLLMLSIGRKPGGEFKDTRVNIEARHDFVVHIPSAQQVAAVNASSAVLDANDSELDWLQLETVPFGQFRLPRLRECRVAYACRLFELQEIGSTPMSLILGQIQAVYIADEIVSNDANGQPRVDADKLDPLARLGGIDFTTIGAITAVPRPELK